MDAPPRLATLVRRAIDWKPGERLGTAAEWIALLEDGTEAPGHHVSGESDQLKGYRVTAEHALEEPHPGLAWREMASVSEAHARRGGRRDPAGPGGPRLRNGSGLRQVAAWNEIGVVAWAFDPRQSTEDGSVRVEPAPPASFLERTPQQLAELVRHAASWERAQGLATEAVWVCPGAESRHLDGPPQGQLDALGEAQGAHRARSTDTSPEGARHQLPGWPPAERSQLVGHALRLAQRSLREDCAIPGWVETFLLAARGLAPTLRLQRVAEAVELLGQIGITWPDAVDRAGRRAHGGG